MFPRAQRLQNSQDILAVLRRGEKKRSGPILLCRMQSSTFRFTCVVDTKVSKRSVIRNKVKRQMRAIFAAQANSSGWYVLRGYPGIEKIDFEELRQHITKCLNLLS